jgi:hypothetical protein
MKKKEQFSCFEVLDVRFGVGIKICTYLDQDSPKSLVLDLDSMIRHPQHCLLQVYRKTIFAVVSSGGLLSR